MPALRALFLLVGATIGVVYPFIAAILDARGFSPEAVGLTTGASAVAFTAAVAVWGHLGDVVTGRVTALRIGAIGSTIVVLGWLLEVPPPVMALLVVGFIGFEASFAPLSDALAVNALAASPSAYSRVRLLASLGFAVATIAVGRLYADVGFDPAPFLWGVGALAIVIVLRWVPDVARFREPGPGAAEGAAPARRLRPGLGSFGVALRVQPRLRGVLLALGLVHIGIVAGFTFLALRLIDLGAGATEIALAAGVSALAEIPTIWLIPRLVSRIGIRALLVAGIVLYGAVIASWAFLADPTLIVASRVVSGVAFGWITVAAVMTIAALLPPELQATGQGLYQVVGFGAASIVANAVGGFVFGAWGALPLFLGCAVIAGFGAVVAWGSVPDGRPVRSPGEV